MDARPRSGRFLLFEEPVACAVPEDLNAEERALGDAIGRFCRERILPHREEIEAVGAEWIPGLLRELGELGLFLLDVPVACGGIGASKRAIMKVAECLGSAGSCGVAALVQSGIGGLPVVYFGSADQRARYLPGISSGETITAYALTEPGSGSDALSASSRARWDEARRVYVLNGGKQFITNAGFADLFVTFAKVDGAHFTAFLLERTSPGLSTGAEEKKMGLAGSSTRSLVFEDVDVPEANVLGEVGKGHRIALGVLNIGRLKLAPAALGGAKVTLREGATYARAREQFGRPIGTFPLIQQKLAEAASRIYCGESMCYRTAGLLDACIEGAEDPVAATVEALREFAVECSINKVFASEALDRVADEMVQIHGGYGFVSDYLVERIYRDARINRIWEGTSEINRMIITGTLLDRARRGQLPLLGAVQTVAAELLGRPAAGAKSDQLLAAEAESVVLAKKLTLFAAGAAAQKHPADLDEQQETLAWLADMVIQVFAMESALLRTRKLAAALDEEDLGAREAAVQIATEAGFTLVEQRARSVLAACHRGEELRTSLTLLRKLQRREPVDLAAAGRRLGARVLERQGYPFDI